MVLFTRNSKAFLHYFIKLTEKGRESCFPPFGGCDPISVGEPAQLGGAVMVLGGGVVYA